MLRPALLSALFLIVLIVLLRSAAYATELLLAEVLVLGISGMVGARQIRGAGPAARRAAALAGLAGSYMVLWAAAQKGFVLVTKYDVYVDTGLPVPGPSPSVALATTVALTLIAWAAGVALATLAAALLGVRRGHAAGASGNLA